MSAQAMRAMPPAETKMPRCMATPPPVQPPHVAERHRHFQATARYSHYWQRCQKK